MFGREGELRLSISLLKFFDAVLYDVRRLTSLSPSADSRSRSCSSRPKHLMDTAFVPSSNRLHASVKRHESPQTFLPHVPPRGSSYAARPVQSAVQPTVCNHFLMVLLCRGDLRLLSSPVAGMYACGQLGEAERCCSLEQR